MYHRAVLEYNTGRQKLFSEVRLTDFVAEPRFAARLELVNFLDFIRRRIV